MVNSLEQLAFGRAKKATLTSRCRECPYLPSCNGGCCKHRIVPLEGEGEKHNWFCEGYRMFFEYTYDRMEAIATALRRGMAPRVARDEYVARQGAPQPILLDASGRPMQRTPAATGKADRNAPCPCGSGLKFKKCCGRKV